jgi:hypothetical protein
MARYFPAILALFFLGCENSPDTQHVIESSRKISAEVEKQLDLARLSSAEAQKTFDESVKSAKAVGQSRHHPAEVVAVQMVSAFSQEEMPAQRPAITRLNNQQGAELDELFRTLQRYIQSQQWNLWFTEIVVLGGKEDVATCFFQSSNQDSLVVMLAFHQNSWVVTACETTATRFARSEDETVDQYASNMVTSVKEQGTTFLEGPLVDGVYFIEH